MPVTSLSAVYKQWLNATGKERAELEELAKRNWRAAWESSMVKNRVAALKFIARLKLVEGQEIAWTALESPEAVIREQAIESTVILLPQVPHVPPRAIESIWAYLLNRSNRRRILALVALEQVTDLRSDMRLGALVDDADGRIASFAREQAARGKGPNS